MRKLLIPMLLFLSLTVTTGCGAGGGGGSATTTPDAVTMDHLAFVPATRTIATGARIELVNSGSRALHVLVVGEDAQPRSQAGAPSFGGASGHRSEVGDHWLTPSWETPGTYLVTCTLHPSMNLTVTVR